MKHDGSLKHLGIKSDMDAAHRVQKRKCIEKIKELGEIVTNSISRSRDKCTALGYCVRTNVVYRAQSCSWSTKDYDDVDRAFLSVARKTTLNMNGFPGRLLTSERRHGGLGIISISAAAHERKRKSLLELINKRGAEGLAAQGLLVSALRSAGQGGFGASSCHLRESLNEGGLLNSLVSRLKTVGLRIRVGANMEEAPVHAAPETSHEDREDLNRSGIVTTAELQENGLINARVGQCWLNGQRIIEILAFGDGTVEFMEWIAIPGMRIGPGCIVYVSARDDYQGYPTGMGGRNSMGKEVFVDSVTALVELSLDWIGTEEHLSVTMSRVFRSRVNKPKFETYTCPDSTESWARWPGGVFLHIYTDGSHAEERSLTQFMLGNKNSKNGGAIVLSDGHSWVHRIYVEIDVEVAHAFHVELICILIANEMAMAQGSKIIIHSDCKSAIDVGNGSPCPSFSNTINGWKRGSQVELMKVKAHPELHKCYEDWCWDDIGIWTADRVASSNMQCDGRVSAAKWLKRIGKRSLVVIEEEDGTPYIGNISERYSFQNISRYWKERDSWRAKDDLPAKWAGTNIALAFSLLKRNGGLEDHSTMLRLAAGKRWDHSRHRGNVCKACQGEFSGLRHPLLQCGNLALGEARKL